jgi:hypothetical protein
LKDGLFSKSQVAQVRVMFVIDTGKAPHHLSVVLVKQDVAKQHHIQAITVQFD